VDERNSEAIDNNPSAAIFAGQQKSANGYEILVVKGATK